MKKIDAYRISDGRCFSTYDEAKKAAQAKYDDAMTKLRHSLTVSHGLIGVREGIACMEWIEKSFELISTAAGLKDDVDCLDDED